MAAGGIFGRKNVGDTPLCGVYYAPALEYNIRKDGVGEELLRTELLRSMVITLFLGNVWRDDGFRESDMVTM